MGICVHYTILCTFEIFKVFIEKWKWRILMVKKVALVKGGVHLLTETNCEHFCNHGA